MAEFEAMKSMKMRTEITTKPSEPDEVNAYMSNLVHPLAGVLEALRQTILQADPAVGEEIKWNAPTFFYTGEMQPSNPKEYKRYLVVSNLFKKDCIRLVFWGAGNVEDPSGLFAETYEDGRRLALFYSLEDVKAKTKALQDIVKRQLALLDQ